MDVVEVGARDDSSMNDCSMLASVVGVNVGVVPDDT